MAKLQVLVVERQPERLAAALGETFPETEITAVRSFADAGDKLASTQVLVAMGIPVPGLRFTPELAAQMPRLEWVQCLLSGAENITKALAGRDDVLITTMAGIHGPQMSELVLLYILALSRSLPVMLRNQESRNWQRVPQLILESKTVGIVGMGTIGTHLAGICQAFGMRVYGFSRTNREVPGVDRMLHRNDLVARAPELDFLVLVVPATPGEPPLVGAEVLAAMKPTSFLINLGRGAVVDDDALVTALRSGTIAGAGLDVFTVEPLPTDSPLWEMENVILTPHVGGHHDQWEEQTLTVIEPNLRAYIEGRRDDMLNRITPRR
jgi:D-2-hydroxyacid dehydrogenase (NADP+)